MPSPLAPRSLPLSVVIVARNEAARLPRCLASLGPAAQVVVIDDLSEDDTGAIALAAGAELHRLGHAGENWDLLKNEGLARATQPWALLLDADEWVPEEAWPPLAEAIAQAPPWAIAWLPRRERHFGAWARHAFSDARVLRLVRPQGVRFAGERLHAHPEVLHGGGWSPFEALPEGAVGQVAAPLEHEAYASVAAYVEKTLRYTAHEARWRFEAGQRIQGGRDLWWPAARYFAHRYLRLGGHRDGLHGLVACLAVALYPLLQQLQLWELQRQAPPASALGGEQGVG